MILMQQLFSILQQVDSTNNYAMAAIRNGDARDGSCWFAMNQTAGKGQRGKVWKTKANENIAMSIVVESKPLFAYNLFNLNALAAVMLRDFCERATGKIGFTIKWPNDIYYGDKKAAGILIENIVVHASATHSVIGIGINVNQQQFDEHLPNPISLKIVSEKTFEIVKLARRLHEDILKAFLEESEVEILNQYNLYLYKRQEQVRLRYNNASFLTTIQHVTKFGELVTKDVIERSFQFGEITWEL
jgi:BirA family biotin operon repressor/biotin-[acetyl-CoA-carboxylase] ligase